MPQILDQEQVFREFTSSVPADIAAPMRPHIAGPEAQLRRYDVATEKSLALLGAYDPTQDTTYDWPNLATPGIVDLDYVKVYIDDALLQYFTDAKSSGDVIAPVAGYKNRIATAGVSGFKTNGAYTRNVALKDRDVAIGDIVRLDDGAETMTTYVADLIATPVNAVIGSATADAANAIAQPNSNPGSAPSVGVTGGGASGGLLAAGTYFVRYSFKGTFGETWASAATTFTSAAGNIPRVTIPSLPTGAASARIYLSPVGGTADQCTLYADNVAPTTYDLATAYASGGAAFIASSVQTAGTANDVNVSAVTSSSYNGSATGDITETYTVVVTTSSTGGNATTAALQVISASGRDNQASVTPAAFASPTSIGTRGLTMTFAHTSDDLIVGQTWQVTVRQVWAVPVATSGGTYSGSESLTYIVRVSRGGLYADATKPQITITTDSGIDSSGPTTVTAAASAVSIGVYGATIQFSNAGLRKGDIYYVPVTGPTDGAFKTILLGNNLTTALQASTDMTLTLYLKKSILVPAQRVSSPPLLNWTADASAIVLSSAIDAYDASFTDSGVAFAVPVKGGTAYAHYRAWIDTHAARLLEVETAEEVAATFGTIHPDNPLAYAVSVAVANSNGEPVLFSGIADPTDVAQWTEMLEILEGYQNIYSLVPLSRDPAVLAAYATHVTARSGDDVGGEWRTAWFNLEAIESIVVVDETSSSDEEVVLATLGDNPSSAGTQYTLLACTSGNGDFVTNNIAAGDIVRYVYSIDAFGSPTYSSYVVDHVVNEDTLVLTSGPVAAIATPQKVEIWRNLTRTQTETDLAVRAAAVSGNKRIRHLWPDKITDEDGLVVEGWFLAAAYAGYIGGIAPHQGLVNLQISGFASTPRSTEFFNNAQLNSLAEAGFVIASTDRASGLVYTRTARTPDDTDVASREEAMVRRDDAIRYLFYNTVAKYHGKANITTSALALIDAELKAAGGHGANDTRIDRIGPLLTESNVVSVRQHATLLDRLVVEMDVTRDYVLNQTTILIVF